MEVGKTLKVLTAFDGETCHDGKVKRVEGIQTHDRDDENIKRFPLPVSLIVLDDAVYAASTRSCRIHRRITVFDTAGASKDEMQKSSWLCWATRTKSRQKKNQGQLRA